jgi:hypothetical protein
LENRRKTEAAEKIESTKVSHLLHHRGGLRKLSTSALGMNRLSINNHLKNAAARRDQLQRGDPVLELEQLLRQTDGLWLVVSIRAILNLNV